MAKLPSLTPKSAPQILKLVQKIECEEEAERKKRMTEESKMGEEAAQRLVLEMKGELKAKEVEEEEARDHAMRIEKKKRQEGGASEEDIQIRAMYALSLCSLPLARSHSQKKTLALPGWRIFTLSRNKSMNSARGRLRTLATPRKEASLRRN